MAVAVAGVAELPVGGGVTVEAGKRACVDVAGDVDEALGVAVAGEVGEAVGVAVGGGEGVGVGVGGTVSTTCERPSFTLSNLSKTRSRSV